MVDFVSVKVSENMKLLILTFFLTLIVDYTNSSFARIAGGHRVTIEEAPYFAHVTHNNTNGGNSVCSGSILAKNFILTAAHCKYLSIERTQVFYSPLIRIPGVTDKHNNFATIDPDAFEINIETVLRHHGKRVQVEKVYANPKFDGKADNYHHDIGLLQLREDIEFNSKAQPVNLPDENYAPADGSDVILSGSGTNPDNHHDSKERLYQVELQVITAQECYKYHHTGHSVKELEDHEICAKGQGRKSGKGGDSGGPLIEKSTDKIVGLVSYGKPNAPTVFCKITDNLDYINSIISVKSQPLKSGGEPVAPSSPPDSVWQKLYSLLKPYMNNKQTSDDWSDDA